MFMSKEEIISKSLEEIRRIIIGGKENKILIDFAENFNAHFLNKDYKNCNYQKNDKSSIGTVEVLITNY